MKLFKKPWKKKHAPSPSQASSQSSVSNVSQSSTRSGSSLDSKAKSIAKKIKPQKQTEKPEETQSFKAMSRSLSSSAYGGQGEILIREHFDKAQINIKSIFDKVNSNTQETTLSEKLIKTIQSFIDQLKKTLDQDKSIQNSLKESLNRHIAAFYCFLDEKNIDIIVQQKKLKAYKQRYLKFSFEKIVDKKHLPKPIEDLIDHSNSFQANADVTSVSQHNGTPLRTKDKKSDKSTRKKNKKTIKPSSEDDPLLPKYTQEATVKQNRSSAICCLPFSIWKSRKPSSNDDRTIGPSVAGIRSLHGRPGH